MKMTGTCAKILRDRRPLRQRMGHPGRPDGLISISQLAKWLMAKSKGRYRLLTLSDVIRFVLTPIRQAGPSSERIYYDPRELLKSDVRNSLRTNYAKERQRHLANLKKVREAGPVQRQRTELGNLGTAERHRFRATIAKFGLKSGWNGAPVKTICLTDLRTLDGKVLCDHLWWNRGLAFESFGVGDIIEFDARVAHYTKGYFGRRDDVHKPLEDDWRLERPTKIAKIGERPPMTWRQYLDKHNFTGPTAEALAKVLEDPFACHPYWFSRACQAVEQAGIEDLSSLTYGRIRELMATREFGLTP
jgi:hypothetical protein